MTELGLKTKLMGLDFFSNSCACFLGTADFPNLFLSTSVQHSSRGNALSDGEGKCWQKACGAGIP